MNKLARISLAIIPLFLTAAPAFADNPAWYAGKYYDPDNAASQTGFTDGYSLYRTIGCPGKQLLDKPCTVPPPPAEPVAQVPESAPVVAAAPEAPPPAPVVAPEPPPPAPVITPEKALVLKDVNFRFNHYNLMKKDVPILDQAAIDLKDQNYPKVQIDGYCDIVGTVKYNLWLSDMRAKTVKKYLVKQGVPADSMATKGYGKTHFIATNKTAEGRAENRRVELHIVK